MQDWIAEVAVEVRFQTPVLRTTVTTATSIAVVPTTTATITEGQRRNNNSNHTSTNSTLQQEVHSFQRHPTLMSSWMMILRAI